MTPTEQDKELRDKVATIVEYWDFSPLQDEDTRIERLKNEIMQLITAYTNKQVGSAFTLGYVEAWKVIAGRYANSSNEDSYLYVSDLIRSLENDEGHQMRVIESNKTGKQWLVVEKISEAELNEAIEAERNKLKEAK